MSAFLPFWLLIAPPLVLFFDSLRSKGATSAMGAHRAPATATTTTTTTRPIVPPAGVTR